MKKSVYMHLSLLKKLGAEALSKLGHILAMQNVAEQSTFQRKCILPHLFGGFGYTQACSDLEKSMNILSIIVGALLAAVAVFGTDQLLAQHGSSFTALGWPGMPLFLAVAAGTAWLGRVLLLLMLVLAWRPRTSLSWSRPAQCASLRDWASSSWDIRTSASRQTGHRVFGLNLALCGGMPKMLVATRDRPTQSR